MVQVVHLEHQVAQVRMELQEAPVSTALRVVQAHQVRVVPQERQVVLV